MSKFTTAERSGLIFITVIIVIIVATILLTRNSVSIAEIPTNNITLDTVLSSSDTLLTLQPTPREGKRKKSKRGKSAKSATPDKSPRSHLDEPINAE